MDKPCEDKPLAPTSASFDVSRRATQPTPTSPSALTRRLATSDGVFAPTAHAGHSDRLAPSRAPPGPEPI
jgi:hypothetical protein